jgi:HAD superfamily hydrolase (TIGR01484 family)
MSKYQAIVFDLDGTAIPNKPDAVPSPKMIATVNKYRDKIHLVAATGRPVRIALPIIEALGLTNPCIVSGGAVIIDPTTEEVLKLTTVPAAAVHAIFDVVQGHDYEVLTREERLDLKTSKLHPTLAENVEIIHIGRIPEADLPGLKKILLSIPQISVSLVPGWNDDNYVLNITHIDSTKEHAVADVLSRIGVPREAAIGVGDGGNDVHLFRSVGFKVAMGNAAPELKAIADTIAPSVEDDGLAEIIERYAG